MKTPRGFSKDNDYKISYLTGQEVKNKFYDHKPWNEGIPQELKDKKWTPDLDKMYKCWWFDTNPADPADPGEDILVYIEEDSSIHAKRMNSVQKAGIYFPELFTSLGSLY